MIFAVIPSKSNETKYIRLDLGAQIVAATRYVPFTDEHGFEDQWETHGIFVDYPDSWIILKTYPMRAQADQSLKNLMRTIQCNPGEMYFTVIGVNWMPDR